MSEIWSIKAMIRNWVGFECRSSPKQLMMACMLLLEIACRCPESRKKLTTLYKCSPYGCGLRMPNVRGEGVGSMRTPADKGVGGQQLVKSCGHLLCMTPNCSPRKVVAPQVISVYGAQAQLLEKLFK